MKEQLANLFQPLDLPEVWWLILNWRQGTGAGKISWKMMNRPNRYTFQRGTERDRGSILNELRENIIKTKTGCVTG
ncbi:MAG: hypothetical protein ACLUGJ_13040 [Blautia wexlerae]